MNFDFTTVANQKIVCIHREELGTPFLGINKETFIAAYKDLNATALALYLYFVSNKTNYAFALSPTAIQNEFGMPKNTCQDQIKKLIKKGYLVQRRENSNIYDFYERPYSKGQKIAEPENVSEEQTPSGLEEWKKVF